MLAIQDLSSICSKKRVQGEMVFADLHVPKSYLNDGIQALFLGFQPTSCHGTNWCFHRLLAAKDQIHNHASTLVYHRNQHSYLLSPTFISEVAQVLW